MTVLDNNRQSKPSKAIKTCVQSSFQRKLPKPMEMQIDQEQATSVIGVLEGVSIVNNDPFDFASGHKNLVILYSYAVILITQ